MTIIIKGYQVVAPGKAKDGVSEKFTVVSRVFAVKDAANQFADLAQAQHPGCYVREVHGL